MQTAYRAHTYGEHSKNNQPQITVKPGEEFIADTQIASGGDWLHSIDDLWSSEKNVGCNPTVCVAVEGAAPGGLLAVDILDITPDALGYTAYSGGGGLPSAIWPGNDWGINTRTVRIEGRFVHWDDKLKLPIRPMIGTLGTAPAGEPIHNSCGGRHGGNMDIQEVRAGTTVYLPIEVPGALLHIGDAHAIQGDGEINGAGGIECGSTARLRVRLLEKPRNMRYVRMEDAEYIMTAACEKTTDESFYAASREMIEWMTESYGFEARDAYLLMGQVLEARVTQYVNPTRSYIVKMPKWALKG